MSEPKTKMTLLLTAPERARLDALRLARGDRSAAATLRALVRDAGGDTPRAQESPGRARLEEAESDIIVWRERALTARSERQALAAVVAAVLRGYGLTPFCPPEAHARAEEADAAREQALERAGLVRDGEVTEAGKALVARAYEPPIEQTSRASAPTAHAPDHEPDDLDMPEPVDLDVPAARADFLARVGCSPEEYLRRWRAGQIPDTGEGMFRYQRALLLEDTPEDDGADAFLEAIHGAAAAAIETELGHCLPQRPVAAAEIAELVLQALPRWAGLDPGGDPPDPLTPAHIRGAARAARELAAALEQLAERA